ncbi:MAG: MFS transporter [Chloroflexota bacterium]|nr:MFS transporter [Chloroflexota bacterium]
MSDQTLWRNGNFLRLWGAQAISLLGSQITLLALPIVALITLDASIFQMGMLAAAATLPAPILGLLAGVWTDRLRRRPILIGADLGRALALAVIPFALWSDVLSMALLYGVSLVTGILGVWFNVAHRSLLPSLVRREQLVDANGKLETSYSGAFIVGPGLAGLLIQFVTAPVAIIVDAISYLASALLLTRIKPEVERPNADVARRGVWAEAREGLLAVRDNPILMSMAMSLSAFNLFLSMLNALLVLYAVRDLGIDPAGLGVIFAVGSAGFPIGAAAANVVAKRIGVGRAIIWGAVVSDLALLLIPLAGVVPGGAIPLLIASRFITMLTGPVTAINQLSLRQSITPDNVLGRTNATMMVLSLGLAPIGGVLAGLLGELFGVQSTILAAAIGVQLGFVILLLSPIRSLDTPLIAKARG